MNNAIGFGFSYLKKSLKGKQRKGYYTDIPQKYAGKMQLSLQEANDRIATLLNNGAPFMVGRYGTSEIGILQWTIARNFGLAKEFSESHMNTICNNAGFFPKDQDLVYKYGNFVLEKSKNLDLLGTFYVGMEEYIIKKYAPQTTTVRLRGLEPWYVEDPWSKALEGKKVLVIHPFEETILSQYKKRELLFPDSPMLPQFELKTIKAVQTIAGEKDPRFENWFEALEYMHDSAMKIDFDVAIIGCGAYGLPLAALIKESGKSAIHLGGATQYLFGIKSKRAEEAKNYNPVIHNLYNENWVRPSDDEKPKNAHLVEDGCYW